MPRETQRSPAGGPRLLFFSGGSALRPLCRILKLRTHNSIHLITPFDSGGSSARLRDSFGILSVGDLRNRLLALADESQTGNPEIYELLAHRFDQTSRPDALRRRLAEMTSGRNPLVAAVPEALRDSVRAQLQCFAERMPADFDLRGASIGNLVLAGGYLAERSFEAVLSRFSELLAVRGTVRPIVEADLHLAVRLEDGQRVVGQHRITGKECPPLSSTVRELELVDGLEHARTVLIEASEEIRELILSADLICYPIGSFFSSVLCNLIPGGVGHAIAAARCPKVYVPNTAVDPEQRGIDVGRAAQMLLETLGRDAGVDAVAGDLLNLVLLDRRSELYSLPAAVDQLRPLEVEPIEVDIVSRSRPPQIDPERLTETLLSLCPTGRGGSTRP
jgi:CofD-related protein of GAK system